jgi:hypothetical protein
VTVTVQDMHAMLQEIATGIQTAKWKSQKRGGRNEWEAITDVGRWHIFVTQFGDPEEPYHCDGAATCEGIVLRLTPTLARRCFDLAASSRREGAEV